MEKHEGLLQSLGQTISQRRNDLGLSQKELALAAGIHRSYLSDVERGLRNVTIGSLENIAQALDTDCATLILKARSKSIAARGV